MSEEKTLVAVYGTLKSGFGNNRLLKNSTVIGKGLTEEKFGLYRAGIPFVTKKEQISNVAVEVYLVDDKTLTALDNLEGHPVWYKREKTRVILKETNKPVSAYLYFNDEEVERNKARLTLVESGEYV